MAKSSVRFHSCEGEIAPSLEIVSNFDPQESGVVSHLFNS